MIASRTDSKETQRLKLPKTVPAARVYPEKDGYISVFSKEIAAFHRHGCDIPADIDIGDILPELILQKIPIISKKYVGTYFSKLKYRMVVLGNRWVNTIGFNFASMVKLDTIKYIFLICAAQNIGMIAINVEEIFLTTRVNRTRKQRSVLDLPDILCSTST